MKFHAITNGEHASLVSCCPAVAYTLSLAVHLLVATVPAPQPPNAISPAKKTVLITGCSQGGIGEHLCRVFHEKGYYVFATLRSPAKAGSLSQLEHLEVVPLEVTSAESIQSAAATVAKRTNGSLDVLVNNAGADFVTPLLDVNLDEAKRLYDINVWSIVATAQAFAPMLIKAKGTMCNISSTAACMPFAYAGKQLIPSSLFSS